MQLVTYPTDDQRRHLVDSFQEDGPEITLTLQLGPRKKTVVLHYNYPAKFERLADLVNSIGRPPCGSESNKFP